MTYMLVVAEGKLGNPMIFYIEMESNDCTCKGLDRAIQCASPSHKGIVELVEFIKS